MATSFHDLPAELVQAVLNDLDLNDMRALRLTSTLVADKVNNSSFREYFRKKHVYVTSTEDLDDFVEITRDSSLACLLEDLVVVGVAALFRPPSLPRYDERDAITDISCQLHGRLLGEALNNIRVNSQSQGLRSLSLEVVTRVGGEIVCTDESLHGDFNASSELLPTRPVWHVTAQTFEIAVIGLAKSQMPLHELLLFTNINRCALGADSLGVILDHDLAPALQDVKKLSMRISARLPLHPEQPCGPRLDSLIKMEDRTTSEGWKGNPSIRRMPKVASGLSSLLINDDIQLDEDGHQIRAWLEMFPALETLEIQWFGVSKPSPSLCAESAEEFFNQTGRDITWPALTRVVLRNVNNSVDVLRDFFSHHEGLKEVELNHVRLRHPGSCSVLRDWLISGNTAFDHLRIWELWGCPEAGPLIGDYLKDRSRQEIRVRQLWWSRRPSSDHSRRLYGPPWRLD